MTLLIAFLLLIHMGASGFWYFFAVILWIFHVIFLVATSE